MLYTIIAIYLVLVLLMLCAAYSHRFFKYYTISKAAAICGFTAMAAAAFFANGSLHPRYFYIMLACFLFCLCGDVHLGVANNKGKFFSKYFIRGVASFAIAHIGFSTAFSEYARFGILDLFLPVFAFFVTLICSRHKAFHFKRMMYPAIIYSIFVGLCCARGLSAAASLGNTKGLLIGAGAALFLISDASILFLYFTVKKPRKYMRLFNLATYYIGLMCLALSCGA